MPPEQRVFVLTYGDPYSCSALELLGDRAADARLIMFESAFFRATAPEVAPRLPDRKLYVLDFTPDLSSVLREVLGGADPRLTEVCRRCRVAMLLRAGELLRREGGTFLLTGETVSERDPLRSPALFRQADEAAGLSGRVLRPLAGWPQNKHDPNPAAPRAGLPIRSPSPPNCRLRDPAFLARAHDLYRYGGPLSRRDIELLAVGRHFRISPQTRLVIGRNESENMIIAGSRTLYELLLDVEDMPGPAAVLSYTASTAEIELAAALCARYAQSPPDREVTVRIRSSRETWKISARPAPEDLTQKMLIQPRPELCDRKS